MNKKCIFIDIDGTIYYKEKIWPSTIVALQKAKANGHKLYICTGRSIGLVPESISSIVDFDGLICSSGSYIKLEDQIFLDYFFPEQLQQEMIDVIDDYNVLYSLETNYSAVYNYFDYGIFDLYPIDIARYNRDLAANELTHKTLLFNPQEPLPETNKICVFTKEGPLTLAAIKDRLPLDNVFSTKEMEGYGWHFFEISPRNVSKGSAINYLVNNHKIPFEDTVAIGDSMNDYEMIKYAEFGIAMGNGDARLKKAANYVTDHIAEDGFYNAFKNLGYI